MCQNPLQHISTRAPMIVCLASQLLPSREGQKYLTFSIFHFKYLIFLFNIDQPTTAIQKRLTRICMIFSRQYIHIYTRYGFEEDRSQKVHSQELRKPGLQKQPFRLRRIELGRDDGRKVTSKKPMPGKATSK